MDILNCLDQIRRVAQQRDTSDCLFRGEPAIYPSTCSSHYRLFNLSNQFTEKQANAVRERLLWIAQFLEVVGLGRPVFQSARKAEGEAAPTGADVLEVIYSFMQH